MLGRDPQHVAGVRLRSAAPVAALAFPALLLLGAAALAALPCDPAGGGCADAQDRAVVLLSIAAPTLPLIAALASNLPRLLVVLVGTAASLPLWGLVGSALAKRVLADHSRPVGWRPFWRRYCLACAAWLVFAVSLLAAYDRLR